MNEESSKENEEISNQIDICTICQDVPSLKIDEDDIIIRKCSCSCSSETRKSIAEYFKDIRKEELPRCEDKNLAYYYCEECKKMFTNGDRILYGY